mmetsp:Transcript_16959/g.30501  ORF Transcript_16959/g.30501 Transcript_16959/m.30501 type:complete len:293 (+) Transcript_16959:6343-7221(+)
MESPRHWYSIAGELLVKCCEGILETRIRPELRRISSVDYNVVLQTVVTESSDIRDRVGFIDLDHDWRISLEFSYCGTLVESWCFYYSTRRKKHTEDLYKQAAISLRGLLLLARMLPAYEKFRERYIFDWVLRDPEDGNMALPQSRNYQIMSCPAGTLSLKLGYHESFPQPLWNVKPAVQNKRQGSTTPPYIDWQALSLNESVESEEEFKCPLETLKDLHFEHDIFKLPPSLVLGNESRSESPPLACDSPLPFSEFDMACTQLLEEASEKGGNAELIEEYYKSKLFARSFVIE